MRILTVIGNRPQFVKAAAVSRALRSRHDEVLVHTGQHYDDELSTDGPLTAQAAARMRERVEAELAAGAPPG